MKALVLAAGLGTRLAPYTQKLPKALFPVAGIPALGRMIANLKRAGCTAIAVNTHHLADQIQSYIADSEFGLPITLSHEPEILGTGGAIRRLIDYWDETPFLVVNADIITDIDLYLVYQDHKRQNAPATLVMHDRPPFNQVWVDAQRRVTGFDRFPGTGVHDGDRKLAFTGIHVLNPEVIRWIPADGFSDIIEIYRRLIGEGVCIHAHVVESHYWQDMGSPERYRDAVVDIMVQGVFRSVFPDSRTTDVLRQPLSGDGSDRRWFRLTAGRHQLIVADHGITPDWAGSEINAFVSIGSHLFARGLPVPRVYAHDGFSGLVFLEDLGNCHLQEVVVRTAEENLIEALYRRVINTWLDLTANAAEGFDPAWTCQSRAYDVDLILEKECRYFVDAFLNGYLRMGVAYDDLAGEFNLLARCTIDHGFNGLIHRDFQSRNIMVRGDRHYLIDYQGARTGPIQYDLASLLIDPYVRLNPELQEHLLAFAVQQAGIRLRIEPDSFIRGFRYCAVTRNLQMLGAFGYLSRVKRKQAFEAWIPAAVSMLAKHIRLADDTAFPKLTDLAHRIGGH